MVLIILIIIVLAKSGKCDGDCTFYFPESLCKFIVIGFIFSIMVGIITVIVYIVRHIRYFANFVTRIARIFTSVKNFCKK